MKPRAVVLLSGGLDSATCLAIAQDRGFEVLALTIDYGQRHRIEIDRARDIARVARISDHRVLAVDLANWGGSVLTSGGEVPKGRNTNTTGIPSTYVPARNTVFLSLALACAEASEARDLFIGANAVDYSGYPDCRPEFVAQFEALANVATRAGTEGRRIRIHAPLMQMNKAEIIETGRRLGVDYGLTHSCYDPTRDGRPCGQCDSCVLRERGFVEAGIQDPAKGV